MDKQKELEEIAEILMQSKNLAASVEILRQYAHKCWHEGACVKHKNKTELFRCYQDRYIKEACNDCGKVIYSDL